MPTPDQVQALQELQRRRANFSPEQGAAIDELSRRWTPNELPQVPEAPKGLIGQFGQWGASEADKRQEENLRLAAHGQGSPLKAGVEAFAPNVVHSIASMIDEFGTAENAALALASAHPVARAVMAPYFLYKGGTEGLAAPYTALYKGLKQAIFNTDEGVTPQGTEQALTKGAMSYGALAGLKEAAPVYGAAARGATGKIIGPSITRGQVATRLGNQRALYPALANVPDEAIAGGEAVLRAAAPVGTNTRFRENVHAALGDMAEIARKTNLRSSKGGIIRPDLRIRAAVDAMREHLTQMYQQERVPQIQRHAGAPVAISVGTDAFDGLEHLSKEAGSAANRTLAEQATQQGVLSLSQADSLARVVNQELRRYESMTPEAQANRAAISPKINGLKALDVELGDILHNKLQSLNEPGLREYERRYAALSAIREQLRRRVNMAELQRNPSRVFGPVGAAYRALRGGSPIAGASQAATANLSSIGKELQTGFDLLKKSGIRATRGTPSLPQIPAGPNPPGNAPGSPPVNPGGGTTPPPAPAQGGPATQGGGASGGGLPPTPVSLASRGAIGRRIGVGEGQLPPETVLAARQQATQLGVGPAGYADLLEMELAKANPKITTRIAAPDQLPDIPDQKKTLTEEDVLRSPETEKRLNEGTSTDFGKWMLDTKGLSEEQINQLPPTKREQFVQEYRAETYRNISQGGIESLNNLAQRSRTDRRALGGQPEPGSEERRITPERRVYTPEEEANAAAAVARRNEVVPRGTIETVAPGEVGSMPTADIQVDPRRFQFKMGVNEKGVSGKLQDVERYDPSKAGVVSVWTDPADGKTYAVNGHHRLDLAQRAGTERLNVFKIVADTAEQARAVGALQNIAEGQGTVMDVAKFLRDSGGTLDDLARENISPTNDKARKGSALARLDQRLFDRVALGDISEGRGVAIGEGTADPNKQWGAIELIEEAERHGRKINDATAAELARMANNAGTIETTQEGLFGPQGQVHSIALEKAELSAFVKLELSKEHRLFSYASSETRASGLRRGGNTLNVPENQRIAQQAAQAKEIYDRLSAYAGPIDQILEHGARRVAQGEDFNAVKQQTAQAVREELDRFRGGSAGTEVPPGQPGSQPELPGIPSQ